MQTPPFIVSLVTLCSVYFALCGFSRIRVYLASAPICPEVLLITLSQGVYEDSTKTEDTRYLRIPKETVQLLKQYRASVLIVNGTDVVAVSKQLSHASVTTAESFHSHIIEESKARRLVSG